MSGGGGGGGDGGGGGGGGGEGGNESSSIAGKGDKTLSLLVRRLSASSRNLLSETILISLL